MVGSWTMDHPSASIRASTSMQLQAELRHSPPANRTAIAVAILLRKPPPQRTTESRYVGNVKPAQQKIIVRPLTRYEIENKLFRKYGADGNGGQILMVIPDPRPSRWHQRRKLRGIHAGRGGGNVTVNCHRSQVDCSFQFRRDIPHQRRDDGVVQPRF